MCLVDDFDVSTLWFSDSIFKRFGCFVWRCWLKCFHRSRCENGFWPFFFCLDKTEKRHCRILFLIEDSTTTRCSMGSFWRLGSILYRLPVLFTSTTNSWGSRSDRGQRGVHSFECSFGNWHFATHLWETPRKTHLQTCANTADHAGERCNCLSNGFSMLFLSLLDEATCWTRPIIWFLVSSFRHYHSASDSTVTDGMG